jgi:hypothetical protein
MNQDTLQELANLYFKKYSAQERQEIRIDFQIQADKKAMKKWAHAEESAEIPELHYTIRDDFFKFFAIRQRISIGDL